LSVETGIAQRSLYAQPSDDTLTLIDVVRERQEAERWTTTHELLAQLVEWVSLVRVEAWLIAGVPRAKLPDPLHIPRPGEKRQEARVMRPSEFARMMVTG
jgi:hypothetical protein